MNERAASRTAHVDVQVIDDDRYFDDFRRVEISAPSIDVETTSGYEPSIERIVDFINHG
jgi:hypothetical protein